MPYVVGMNYQAAQAAMISAGVYNPSLFQYYGTDPLSADWRSSSQIPGTVLAQSIAAGAAMVTNSAVTLWVSRYPMGVSEPTTHILAKYVTNPEGELVTNPQGQPVIS